jgi:hypothetical protein
VLHDSLVRPAGVEPALTPWQDAVLPLTPRPRSGESVRRPVPGSRLCWERLPAASRAPQTHRTPLLPSGRPESITEELNLVPSGYQPAAPTV